MNHTPRILLALYQNFLADMSGCVVVEPQSFQMYLAKMWTSHV